MSRRDDAIVAWHEVPGRGATSKDPSRRVRCDCCRCSHESIPLSSSYDRCIPTRTGLQTLRNGIHTVPAIPYPSRGAIAPCQRSSNVVSLRAIQTPEHKADQHPLGQSEEIASLNDHAVFIGRFSGRSYCLFEVPRKSSQLGCRSRIRRVFGARRLLLWLLGKGGESASEAPPCNERLLTKS